MNYFAILGLGVVGQGTADFFLENQEIIKLKIGEEVTLKYALDLRDFPNTVYEQYIVHSIEKIVEDKDITIVAETMGGLHPAYEFTKACLESGKSVVSSNKQLVSTYGPELLQIAKSHGVSYLFEASTGGAIPLLHVLKRDLCCNDITEIYGILNGTTNYILTQMFENGSTFDTALKEAQALGYAEKDPSADVDGIDTCRKICILGATITGVLSNQEQVYTEGIRHIQKEDVEYATKNGYSVKLLGMYKKGEDPVVLTAPFFVPNTHMLSSIKDVFNGAFIKSNFAGETLLYGRGAGSHPTASAVSGDILSICQKTQVMDTWTASNGNERQTLLDVPFKRYICVSGVDTSLVKDYICDGLVVSQNIQFLSKPLTDKELQKLKETLKNNQKEILSTIRVL